MPVTPPFISGCVTLASLCFTALCFPEEAGTTATPTWGEEAVGLTFKGVPLCEGASQVVVKNPPANARDARDAGSIPGSGRFPWRRRGLPIPAFLPRNSHGHKPGGLHTVREVAKSRTRRND